MITHNVIERDPRESRNFVYSNGIMTDRIRTLKFYESIDSPQFLHDGSICLACDRLVVRFNTYTVNEQNVCNLVASGYKPYCDQHVGFNKPQPISFAGKML